MRICIAGLSFASKKKAKRYFKDVFNACAGSIIQKTCANFDLLHLLWQRSTHYVVSADPFFIVMKIGGQLFIRSVILNGCIDWSLTNAVSRKITSNYKMLYEAFRNSILQQVNDFKNNNTNQCTVCKCIGVMEVDHYIIFFHDLVKQFLKKRSDMPNNFDYVFCRWHFREQEFYFRDAWLEFHQSNAILRLLCSNCHSSYTKRSRKTQQID